MCFCERVNERANKRERNRVKTAVLGQKRRFPSLIADQPGVPGYAYSLHSYAVESMHFHTFVRKSTAHGSELVRICSASNFLKARAIDSRLLRFPTLRILAYSSATIR